MSELFAGLPPTVRIGPFDIKIIILDEVDDQGSFGSYRHGLSIELRKDQTNGVVAVDTLMHEIAHGIWRNAGISGNEEKVVSAFATGFTQVFRDNPKALAWITGSLKENEC